MKVFSHKTKIHPVRMFAIILYAYSRGIYSTRDIELACHENIKFRFLLQKDDYMRKPRYNLQIEAISKYICTYYIFPNLSALNSNIKNVVADAGYESINNYEYLEKMDIIHA